MYNEMGVLPSNPNIPVFYFRSDGREESYTLTIFDVFTPGPPDDSKFDVSTSCYVASEEQKSGTKESKWYDYHTSDRNVKKIKNFLLKKVQK